MPVCLFYSWFRRKETATLLCLSLIHISEPTRRVVISYAVFCLKKGVSNEICLAKYHMRCSRCVRSSDPLALTNTCQNGSLAFFLRFSHLHRSLRHCSPHLRSARRRIWHRTDMLDKFTDAVGLRWISLQRSVIFGSLLSIVPLPRGLSRSSAASTLLRTKSVSYTHLTLPTKLEV